jgi:hypothetical protein
LGRVIPFVTRLSARGDFSAEERARLAELGERYAAAGVRVEVIFGATEEGDPWCVVKDEAEEVLIHVARIGDTFVVHYALDDALRQGQDLRSVLRERLAWEDRPEVVVPFSRQAQSLLALIVAASFMRETAPPHGDDPAPIAPEPADHHLAATAAGAPLAASVETAIAGKAALHADAFGLFAPAVSAPETAQHPIWRDVADESPLRFDHGSVQLTHVTPGGPAAPVANLEVAALRAPEAPTPMVMAFDAHPRPAPVSAEAPAAAATSGPVTAMSRQPDGGPQTQSEPHAPPTPEGQSLMAAHWIEIDTDGDGKPDTRVQVPDEPPAEKPDHDHMAMLAVGHGFPHADIA